MSEKLFESLSDGADFEKKLIKHGVTIEEIKAASSSSATLGRLAKVFHNASGDWSKPLLKAEQSLLKAFFGRGFDLAFMQEALERYGQTKVEQWKKMDLEVHYWPDVGFIPDSDHFPGWKVKPEKWYWEQLSAGNLFRREESGKFVKTTRPELQSMVVLVDTRKKPAYADGKQMFAKDRDYMGRVIERLRKDGKLAHYGYGPQTSRFGISSIEWEDHLKAAIAERLGLDPTQVRLEMTIEANIIPQLYTNMPRKDDGTTSTWCWYEEFFEDTSRRLLGGYSVSGGLANVSYLNSDNHWDDGAVRPLGVLAAA